MVTLKDQLVKIVKASKVLKEGTDVDTDRLLGTIDKFLNESVDKKVDAALGK